MRHTRLHLARRTGCLAIVASLAIGLSGCQIVASSQQFTQVRYIDVSPDAPGLDIYQNTTASFYNIGFGSVSSYIPVSPGTYNYSVDTASTQQQLATVRATFTNGNQYTILVGNISSSLQMQALKDESAPAPSGQVALRFLDQATRVGAVDIYLVPSNGTLATTAPFLSKVAFNNPAAYINLPSGAYSIVVVPTGTATQTTTTTTTTTTGTTTTTSTTTSTIPTLYSGNQVVYPGASVRTIVLVDQPLSSPATIQAITANDYDSPSATT